MKFTISAVVIVFLLLLSTRSFSQSIGNKRSVLSSGSPSKRVIKGVQSIGQAGPIGKGVSGPRILFQGFVQPAIYLTPVSEETELKGISIFPNPFSATLKLASETVSDSPVLIRIIDLQGREVLSIRRPQETQIALDLNHIQPGNYILQITQETKSAHFKILKIR